MFNMRKKIALLVVIVLSVVCGFFWIHDTSPTFTRENCPFCNSAIINSEKFYEDDDVLALCTYKPVMPGHCLVIPKRHVERFDLLSDTEVIQIGQVIRKVNLAVEKVYGTSAYLLLEKNGREVGQTVPHVHFHYMPRKTGDDSMISFLCKMFIANWKKPISRDLRQQTVETMKVAMNS
jgi:histidine triad (HIT) family protein